jgi:hypothetical protein
MFGAMPSKLKQCTLLHVHTETPEGSLIFHISLIDDAQRADNIKSAQN